MLERGKPNKVVKKTISVRLDPDRAALAEYMSLSQEAALRDSLRAIIKHVLCEIGEKQNDKSIPSAYSV